MNKQLTFPEDVLNSEDQPKQEDLFKWQKSKEKEKEKEKVKVKEVKVVKACPKVTSTKTILRKAQIQG